MTYKIKTNKVKEKKVSKTPYRIITQENSEGRTEVWQLPNSQYAIQYLNQEKGNDRWRVIEVYTTKDGEIRTRGDIPYKNYDSYLKALKHIQYNYEIEKKAGL